MKRPSSLPILFQVAALAVLAVLLSQAVAFAVVVLSPDPRPPGFSIAAAADALQGRPAETSDGRPLVRTLRAKPPDRPRTAGPDPLSRPLQAALAQRLGVQIDRVRVHLDRPPPHFRLRTQPPGVIRDGESSLVVVRRQGAPPPDWRPDHMPLGNSASPRVPEDVARGSAFVVDTTVRQFTVLADRLTFAPFVASVRLSNGQWATVEPPRGLLNPWQERILLGLVISLLLLAPLVWWMARRLTRPIRVFAEAAERLGADPEAEPLRPTGPTEVRTAIGAFNDMQASLRAHMRQRTQTVAAIAHDLRTPLTRLRFRAEAAPEPLRDRMNADIEEMDALIGQAMAFVRGESQPERRERIDLAELAEACVLGFAETGANIRLVPREPLPVLADPASVRRAIGNLIGNALKYGGVARVSLSREDGQAVLRVADDGPGLPPEELEAVFEPFRRGEVSRSRETGGAGLGLTIARQAARAAGGDVRLEAPAGGGLTAILTLPLA